MNLVIDGYVEQITIARGTGNATAVESLRRNLVAIMISARRHGFTFDGVKRAKMPPCVEPPRWLDRRLPREQALMVDLFSDVEGDLGRLMHRMASSVLHAKPHGLKLFIGPDQGPTELAGVRSTSLRLSLGDLARWTAAVVYGSHRVMLRACGHYGWSVEESQDSAQPVIQTWRSWIDLP